MNPNQTILIVRSLAKESDSKPGGPFVASPNTQDEPLSERSEKVVGPWLIGRLAGRRFRSVRSGPEVRCRLTGVKVAHAVGGTHNATETYRGRRWGEFAGRPCADVRAALESLGSGRRRSERPKGGESWMDVETRIRQSLFGACDIGENFALVADASICRVAAGILTGSPAFAGGFFLENGGFAEFCFDGEHWNLVGEVVNPPADLS